jgi:hypothetical protein
MGTFKYRRNYNTFYFKKNSSDYNKYYRDGYRYHELLPSGRYTNLAGGALHKAWIGYIIAINKFEFVKEIKYAKIIRKLQRELGLELSDFDCLIVSIEI